MTLFYELIQVALGNGAALSKNPSAEEWRELFETCQKQAVVGVAFDALEELSRQEQKPPLEVLYQWIGMAEQIRQRNLIVNRRCMELSGMFAGAGFRTCVLKGQGNARLYQNPLSRTPGDIDIWVDANRSQIDDFVHVIFPDMKGGKMHIEYPVFADVAVEVHYLPIYMYAPQHDRQLQSFFKSVSNEQFEHRVTLSGANDSCAVATPLFNVVQQLVHMMNHVMGEGIGLRQFIDYYFVLKSIHDSQSIIRHWPEELEKMGLLRFAQGVMWIEKNLVGLEDEYLIVEPSERIGRAIQLTIEEGGNFGHHSSLNTLRHKSLIGRAVGGMHQLLRAMHYFPSEAAWKIIRKVY